MFKAKPKTVAGKPLAVSVNEACATAGIGRTKLYDLIANNKIKAVQIGRRRLIVYASLEALVNEGAA